MDHDEFREALERLNLSQGALARLFCFLGDPANGSTVKTRVERWASGKARVPGEAVAFLSLLDRYPALLPELLGAMSEAAARRHAEKSK